MTPAEGSTPHTDPTTGTRSGVGNLFIEVEVDPEAASDAALAAKLTEVCPVDIYAQADDGSLRIVRENLDECVLCRLCIDAAPPGSVTVRKLYDDGAAL